MALASAEPSGLAAIPKETAGKGADEALAAA